MATLGNTPRPAYVYDTETDTWVPVGVGAHTHAYIPNTLVDAKGDLITATANDVPAILSKGADGTVLVSDSTTQTGLAWQPYAAPFIAGKNLLINGGFDFWQRGTSWTGTPTANTPYYATADRWMHVTGTGSNSVSFTRVAADTPGQQYGIRFGRNSGASGTAPTILGQIIESTTARQLAGKTVTLSFYAKQLSSFTPNFIVNLITGTGVDEGAQNLFIAWTGGAYAVNLTQPLTQTMTRYSFTATIPAGTNQIAVMFPFYPPSGTAGANEFIQIEGVQLEVGSIATTFTRASGTYQAELAACQRYYYRVNAFGETNYPIVGFGAGNSTTQARTIVNLPVQMRTKPYAIDYSAVGNFYIFTMADGQFQATGVTLDSNLSGATIGWLMWAATGLTANTPYYVRGNNSAGLFFGFSAEL